MSHELRFVTEDYDIPITNMIDINGDETGNPEEAHAIVGPLPDGRWLASASWVGDIVKREVKAA